MLMTRFKALVLVVVFCLMAQGWGYSGAGMSQVESPSAGPSGEPQQPQVPEAAPQEEVTPPEEAPEGPVQEQVQPAPVSSQPQVPASAAGMEFRFQGIPITTVIDTVMRELGYSYIVDPQVQGTASIYTMGAIPRENAFEVLEQLLQMNGQGIVKHGDLYVVVPLGQTTRIPHRLIMEAASRSQAQESQEERREATSAGEAPPEPTPQVPPESSTPEPVVSSIPPPEEPSEDQVDEERGVVTYVIPLHYIPSGEMVTIITPFVSNGANIINHVSSNMIILTDFRENVEQVLRIVNLLDSQYFDVNSVDLIPIRYNQAIDVADDLSQIFMPGDPAGVRIIAIERLNSILVVTRSISVFQKIMEWIGKLDAPSANTNIKTFVYQVQNNTAMNIAEILGQLYQDGLGLPSGASGQTPEGQARQPAGSPREAGFVPPTRQGIGGPAGQLGPSLAGRPMSRQSGIRAVVSGNIKIIVNEFNNSLIIQATEADYQFLLQTIKQLDVLPRQVLIEAKIYSVELRDDLSFGLTAFMQERNRSAEAGPATTGSISPPTGGGVGGALTLTTRTVIGASRELETTINALRTKTNVKLLEAPRILAVDGMQAQLNIGAEVPVTTASFGDPVIGGSPTSFVNSIQFRPTGVTLLILPRISASGVVTMDLAIEVSSATGASLTPTINRNFITTTLIVRDQQTVAIAGIISETLDITKSRVPILGDIPILGALFGQTSRIQRRVELVFFITPHVIRTLPTATELTLEFRRALLNSYDFIGKKETEERELIESRREEELR